MPGMVHTRNGVVRVEATASNGVPHYYDEEEWNTYDRPVLRGDLRARYEAPTDAERLQVVEGEIEQAVDRIRTARDARELIGWLKSLVYLCHRATQIGLEEIRVEDQIDVSYLPTWGPRPNPKGAGLWSWDQEVMVVGDSIAESVLVRRPDVAVE